MEKDKERSVNLIEKLLNLRINLKGKVHTKMKILSFFIHSHVVPNMY